MLSRVQIRQFLAVVDTGSFTRAAAALNVAQPSLSGGIAELERQLGTRLFERERRRIGLTPAGNTLLPLARAIERGFHQIETQVGSLPGPLRPIRVGVLETISSDAVARAIAAYAAPEPLELTEGSERELHSALSSGAVDLAVTLLAPGGMHEAEEILHEDYCLALPATHRLAEAERVSAAEVAGETMIARRSCELLSDTSRFFTERGVRPRFALRSAHDERAMAMVCAGLGVTVAPRSLGGEGIAMVPIAEFDRSRRVGIVYGQHFKAQYGTGHALVEALRHALSGRAAGDVTTRTAGR